MSARGSSINLMNAITALETVSVVATNSDFFEKQALKLELEKSRKARELAETVNSSYAQEFASALVDDDLVAKARAMRQRRNSR